MAGNKTLNENKATSQKPLKKRVYRLKLEIDIFAMINEGTERIERGLQISVKDSDIYFDKYDDKDFLKQYFEDEYDFFSKRCFNDLKAFLALLRREIGFNQVGTQEEREKFIQNYLRVFEKGLRKRLNSARGRPKTKKENQLLKLLKSEEVYSFVKEVRDAIEAIQDRNGKITKTAIAEELFSPNHSNPLLAFNRKLKDYCLNFDNVIKSITHEEYLYENLVEPLMKQIEEKHNNKSREI